MIARYWRGSVRAADADDYADYVRRTGVATQRGTPGNLGSMVLFETDGETSEVVVISLWESLEAIVAFAGEPVDRAVFYPEDGRYLVSADQGVRHFEVPVHSLALG